MGAVPWDDFPQAAESLAELVQSKYGFLHRVIRCDSERGSIKLEPDQQHAMLVIKELGIDAWAVHCFSQCGREGILCHSEGIAQALYCMALAKHFI
eukprot:1844688-Amphidinium_carterae.1